MNKKDLSEQQLNDITNQLHQASLRVEQLSNEVSKGLATKSELEKAISHLQNLASKVKIKQAQDKVLSGWKVHRLGVNEFPKDESQPNPLLILLALIAMAYLVLG